MAEAEHSTVLEAMRLFRVDDPHNSRDENEDVAARGVM